MNKVILASQSAARISMLRTVGLEFDIMPAHIDEGEILEEMLQQKTPLETIVTKLSGEKALKISQQNPDALVIGSDQILECDGQIISKASTEEEAKEKLRFLSGKDHRLISGVAVCRNNELLWQDHDEAVLTMRSFGEEYLEDYAKRAGEALVKSVGAYELEKKGAWLFTNVKGDYFTILGMPLLKLLSYWQEHHGERYE